MTDVSDEALNNEPHAYLKRRKFQLAWKVILPWVIFIVGAGVIAADAGASHGRASAESFVCPQNGADCPGCIQHGRMICSLCVERNTRGTSFSGCDNPWVNGYSRMLVADAHDRAMLYHSADLPPMQCDILEQLAKQLADEIFG